MNPEEAIVNQRRRRNKGDEFDTLVPARGFLDAFRKEYSLGREHWAEVRRRQRDLKNQSENAPRFREMTESYPLGVRIAELLGKTESENVNTRNRMGMGLEEPGNGRRAGQLLGTVAADLTQDTSRNFYWLLNALQATGNVITESALGKANPDLFGIHYLPKGPIKGYELNELINLPKSERLNITEKEDREKAIDLGYLTSERDYEGGDEDPFKIEETRRGLRIKPDRYKRGDFNPATQKRVGQKVYTNQFLTRPNYTPGDLNALMIPTGFAINSGLGLMTPTGGYEGYEAVVPDAEDKSKTSNAVLEIAAKYILGRTGNLLPYDEFSKVRPDVSPEEYRAYKAFKYDKNVDLNPFDDGKMTLPTGVVKTTNDGIHGPEIQFLGRGLPVTTGLVPFASALVGTTAGVRSKRPIQGGLLGGLAGLAAGSVSGNLIEQERRNRNMRENERKSQQVPQQGF